MSALPPDPATRRTRWLAGLLLAAVFVAGALVGAVGEHFRQPPFPGFFPGPPPLLPAMVQDLGLSPEQQRQVEAIFERQHPQLEAIMHETFPRMRAIMEAAEKEVDAVLTPAQRIKAEQTRSRFGHEPPPPDGRPGDRPPHPQPFFPGLQPPPASRPESPAPPASQPASERTDVPLPATANV